MPARFQRLEDFLRGCRFGFRNAARDAELRVDVEPGRAPELAGRGGLRFPVISTLRIRTEIAQLNNFDIAPSDPMRLVRLHSTNTRQGDYPISI